MLVTVMEALKRGVCDKKTPVRTGTRTGDQIINKPLGVVWRGSALPLHFQSILAACTPKSRVFTKRSD